MSTISSYVPPTDAIATALPLPGFDKQPLVAEVLGAEATATTYLINCRPGTDSNDCGVYNASVTVGPWASMTLPPGAAATGVLDFHISRPDPEDPFEFSIHCLMSRSVAQECTTINIGGNNDGHPTVTFTSSDMLDAIGLATIEYQDVTITAGQALLEAAATATPTTDAEASGSQTGDAAAASGSGDSGSAAPIWGVSRWVAAGALVVVALANGITS